MAQAPASVRNSTQPTELLNTEDTSDRLSPTTLVLEYLKARGMKPNAENIRRAIELNAREGRSFGPDPVGDEATPLRNAAPEDSSPAQQLTRRGSGAAVNPPAVNFSQGSPIEGGPTSAAPSPRRIPPIVIGDNLQDVSPAVRELPMSSPEPTALEAPMQRALAGPQSPRMLTGPAEQQQITGPEQRLALPEPARQLAAPVPSVEPSYTGSMPPVDPSVVGNYRPGPSTMTGDAKEEAVQSGQRQPPKVPFPEQTTPRTAPEGPTTSLGSRIAKGFAEQGGARGIIEGAGTKLGPGGGAAALVALLGMLLRSKQELQRQQGQGQ